MSAVAQPDVAAANAIRPAYSLIDTDAHHNWSGVKDILPYLPRYWADYVIESQFKSLPNSPYPKGVGGGERVDARPGDVGSAGSDVDLFRRQLTPFTLATLGAGAGIGADSETYRITICMQHTF